MYEGDFDPEILQEFLAESCELLDELEGDLVELERAPADPELLNKAFRALHTIKGSASFLGLRPLVEIAHAAESALNSARAGTAALTPPVMNLLLAAVDVVGRQLDEVRRGAALTAPDGALVVALGRIGASEPAGADGAGAREEAGAAIPPAKAELAAEFAADIEQTLAAMGEAIDMIARAQPEAALGLQRLGALGEELGRSAAFLELRQMERLAAAVQLAAGAGTDLDATARARLATRLEEIIAILRRQCAGLRAGRVVEGDCTGAVEKIGQIVRADVAGGDAPPAGCKPAPLAPPAGSKPAPPGQPAPEAEQTIRVEVGRLEALLNLVGELVLQKNRIGALARGAGPGSAPDPATALREAAGALDRVSSEIQVAVMRARMQPLDKLLGKYPRLIRDLAQRTGKRIELEIEGGETEVDRSVIEELGDPLVHLLRNCADHGIEPPDARRAAGKPEAGTIRLSAASAGGHVQVRISDDGAGLSRERICARAVERGLIGAAEAARLRDREVYQFIFAPGFSTAEQVSDLSGRGVGMDVVRANIEKIKGSIELDSTPGRGTTITLRIPLTVAIMQAMLVGVGGVPAGGGAEEIYAIPLANIVEVVRPAPEAVSTIGGAPALRLRGEIVPLMDARRLLELPSHGPAPLAVILTHGGDRLGLLVSRLIGQQEIVIKPLRGACAAGAAPGATVAEDGRVRLIVDVAQVLRLARRMNPDWALKATPENAEALST